MREFITSPMFFAILGGFLISYLVQVLIMGPRDKAKNERMEDYVSRLSEEARIEVDGILKNKDKTGAISFIQEHAKIGKVEAKDCVNYLIRQMKKK